MKFIKKIRDDRKGLAIELAMMVMVVTFAVSILLTTVALLQVDHSSSNMQEVKRRYKIEQIGANYVAWVKAGAEGVFSGVPSGFTYKCDVPEVPVVEEDTSTSNDDATEGTIDDTQEGNSEESDDNKSSENENSDVASKDAEVNDNVTQDNNTTQQEDDANANDGEGSGDVVVGDNGGNAVSGDTEGDVSEEGNDGDGDTTEETEKKEEATESVPKDAVTPGKYTLTVKDENGNVVLTVVLEVSKAEKVGNTSGNTVKITKWELN